MLGFAGIQRAIPEIVWNATGIFSYISKPVSNSKGNQSMSDLSDLEFNAADVEPERDFAPLPAGVYEVAIVGADVVPTKDGGGKYLKLELQVCGGEFQNRKLFENLNLWNANATTVQIAKSSLSAICRAVGVMTPKDSQELVGKSLRAKVKIVEKKDAAKNVIPGEYQNRVAEWSARNGAAPVTTATATPAVRPDGTQW